MPYWIACKCAEHSDVVTNSKSFWLLLLVNIYHHWRSKIGSSYKSSVLHALMCEHVFGQWEKVPNTQILTNNPVHSRYRRETVWFIQKCRFMDKQIRWPSFESDVHIHEPTFLALTWIPCSRERSNFQHIGLLNVCIKISCELTWIIGLDIGAQLNCLFGINLRHGLRDDVMTRNTQMRETHRSLLKNQ